MSVYAIQDLVDSNKSFEEIYPVAVEVCVSILNAVDISGQYMCPGIISAYGMVVST